MENGKEEAEESIEDEDSDEDFISEDIIDENGCLERLTNSSDCQTKKEGRYKVKLIHIRSLFKDLFSW